MIVFLAVSQKKRIAIIPGDGIGPELKYEMCSMPTLECLKQMFEAVGAKKVTVKYRPSFRMWKKFLALVKNRPQSGRAIVHVEF